MNSSDRVYFLAGLFGGKERHYGHVVNGRVTMKREEGVGPLEPHILVQSEDDGRRYSMPVRKLKPASPSPSPAPRYHIVAVSTKTGKETLMTSSPVTHAEGVTMMRKMTNRPQRRIQLKEVW